MTDTITAKPATKCTIKELKAIFEENPALDPQFRSLQNLKVTMTELKDLKAANAGKDYDAIANGIGNDSMTY